MSEGDVKKATLAALAAIPHVKALRLNSGNRGRFRGCPAGTPDILVLLPGGRCIWLELKREKRKANESNPATVEAQAKWHEAALALGHAVLRTRDAQEAAEFVIARRDAARKAAGAARGHAHLRAANRKRGAQEDGLKNKSPTTAVAGPSSRWSATRGA